MRIYDYRCLLFLCYHSYKGISYEAATGWRDSLCRCISWTRDEKHMAELKAIAEDNFIDAFSSFPLSAYKRGTSTGYRKICLMTGVCLCLLLFTHSQCSQVRFQNLVCGRPVFQFLFHACDRIASESCALACTATRAL